MDDFAVIGKILEVSFPVGVAAYLLIRVDSRLADLTSAIVELRALLMRDKDVSP